MTGAESSPSRWSPLLRVATLDGVVALVLGVASAVLLCGRQALQPVPFVGFATLFGAFLAAEAMPVHFEHRREAVSITLTTVPLVVGLVAAPPSVLVAAHLAGTALALVAVRRQSALKVTTNLVSFWVQTLVTIAAFEAFGFRHAGPSTWLPILFSVALGDAAQTVVLTSAISLFQARWEGTLRRTAVVSSGAAMVQTSVGLVSVSLLTTQPLALAPLLVVVAFVLRSLHTHRALGERHQELGRLHALTLALGDAQLEGTLVATLVDHVREVMHAEHATVLLEGAHGLVRVDPSTQQAMPATAEEVALHRSVHSGSNPLLRPGEDLVAAALCGPSGAIGTLVILRRSGQVRSFGDDDARLLSTVANHAGAALENDRLVERLREQARQSEHDSLHDALTGLPNRVLFGRRLEAALATGRPAAVLLLDLDRFKEVNDTLGHRNGDLLLQDVGERIRRCLGSGALVARLGGDEFAALIVGGDEEEVTGAARAVVDVLEEPFAIGDMSVDVGASVGVALAPRDGTDAVVLMQRADVAMYTAKADQSGVERYQAARDGYSADRLALVGELRRAVQERIGLSVHYQPQVDLVTGEVIGVEALVRWDHPSRGRIGPDEFIPVAEHTGLIGPLTRFVLDQALATVAALAEAGHDMRMSVNLSARSLLQRGLVDDVAALLRRHGVPPTRLCLEVTESSIMADPRRSEATLMALRDIGASIAIDDFGTGHSSLAYIKRLPVAEIKIDKSFVLPMLRDHSDAAIVRAVLHLGADLDLAVVAEGIEDEATAEVLRDLGCPIGQGYHFARPMPGVDLFGWLDLRHRMRVQACPA